MRKMAGTLATRRNRPNNSAPSRRYLQSGFVCLRRSRRAVCVLFAASRTRYLNTVSAAGPARIPLSLLFLELIGYYESAVRRHVTSADVLVSHGVDRATSD